MHRSVNWILGGVVVAVVAIACSSSSTGAGGSGTTTSASGASSTTKTTSKTTSTTGGSTTAASCDGLISNPNACGQCLIGQCCEALDACAKNATCWTCLAGSGSGCDATAIKALTDAVDACTQSKCKADCVGKLCNPVNNQGCDTANGEACDLSNSGDFICFGPPNDGTLCGACNNNNGPFCKPGLHCLADIAKCVHYCCDDGDCGAGGHCDKTLLSVSMGTGLCVGAAGDAGAPTPACEAPVSAPSNGACYTIPSGGN